MQSYDYNVDMTKQNNTIWCHYCMSCYNFDLGDDNKNKSVNNSIVEFGVLCEHMKYAIKTKLFSDKNTSEKITINFQYEHKFYPPNAPIRYYMDSSYLSSNRW